MAAIPPVCDFGTPIKAFSLPGTDGKTYTLDDVKGPNGTLVMFICNHCPYVLAVIDRIVRDAKELAGARRRRGRDQRQRRRGLPAGRARAHGDDGRPSTASPSPISTTRRRTSPAPSMPSARPISSATTPSGELQYRGRLDASRKEAGPADLRRELFEAMKQVAETGKGPREQVASMGCSIKWKD